MILSITNHQPDARQLGFLLGKHPDRVQAKELPFGKAQVFFPEATAERCTAALWLDINPVALTRSRGKSYAASFQLSHYVNDRPYTASSFLSVALSKVYGSALNGNCSAHPELPGQPLPLEASLSAVRASGGEAQIRRYFEPLGYKVKAIGTPLDPQFPEWGESPYFQVRLSHSIRLQELLQHLYVLIPALDNNKHYYVGEQEVEKLLDKGEGWLESHPEATAISRRYLKKQRALARQAMEKLRPVEEPTDTPEDQKEKETELEAPLKLHEQRHERVVETLRQLDVRSVLDLGCSSGKLLRRLLMERFPERITGMDVSLRALEVAKKRLNWETMGPKKRERLQLLHGSLTYRDRRLEGYDAAVAVEVIEHFDPPRLTAFERAVFEYARPEVVLITTPNREYNKLFENMPEGQLRHPDHRFEWTREEFKAWARRMSDAYGYACELQGIGPEHKTLGAPSQLAVFKKS
ncbi:3' terminal RNA ribose 2'-O-methyltransferase Hen1 [Phaeodactylibacter sp.]|uniref:3' terminal RNA ribose 2'-O-methyltransferase Hen1 n=1 Tax=Phaeodactylibacter sp. TaxID=1940289 RepID=UPI0025E628F5|nr:3' terminal RNA ribose 2'-O-methyltransferase Hen1 [Phaeodactylibacter sp.]MCI4649811.1 3' terminal RNA ribose 2'-O-methyltransferase Hen1 [Phaeodactylibacter sp.]MCI5092227.1 3' terminal RNA ribose 2'-O-methyltransferase Hen1 [Phaeodactylibacter sp.]